MRILMVDDSRSFRLVVKEELGSLGAEIHEAPDGETALELFRSLGADLVTLDWEMPGMKGPEVCREIRRIEAARNSPHNVPVIFLTSQDSPEIRAEGFSSGGLEFIIKPLVPGELLRTVRSLLTPLASALDCHVLIVDDDDIARRIIRLGVQGVGACCHEAKDGLVALEMLRSRQTSFDLVLTDLQMPGLDGLGLCRRIRQELHLHDLPLIAVSANPDRAMVLDLFKAGASDYLVKPFLREELAARVITQLRTRLAHRDQQAALDKLKRYVQRQEHFLAVTTHDLRSPLASMATGLRLLAEKRLVSGEGLALLPLLQESNHQLLDLVGDLMDRARLDQSEEDLRLETLDLGELLLNAAELHRSNAEARGIRLELGPAPPEAIVQADRAALLRILGNLLSNAIKFTEGGGAIKLQLGLKDGQAEFSVSDTGIGMDAAQVKALFEKFTKSSRPGVHGEAGTGLGMHITQSLVEKLGGRITVESCPAKGSCFSVCLPLYREAGPAAGGGGYQPASA